MQLLIYDMCIHVAILKVEVPFVLCVAYYIQRRFTYKRLKIAENKPSAPGGHRFESCRGLRFFSSSHARDMLIKTSSQELKSYLRS